VSHGALEEPWARAEPLKEGFNTKIEEPE